MRLKHFDFILLLCVTLLAGFGIIVIYSASYNLAQHFAFRQLLWFLIGFVICVTIGCIDSKIFSKLAIILYFLSIGLLCLVMVKGTSTYGAQSWISLGKFKIQPSEFSKIAIILILAFYLSLNSRYRQGWGYIIGALLIAMVPIGLILKQPDLGTALVCLPIVFVMLLASGARLKYLMILVLIGILALPMVWFVLKDYQKARILVFINPNIDPLGSGYTIIQSKIAIGSGGFWGQGWLGGTQTRLRFLPERHTDFIFSVIGEEWGFVGSFGVLILFFIILNRGMNIARMARNSFGKLVALGIVVMIFSHVLINIGMTVGVMPITGLPLPFVSYGGSCILTMMMAIGILESICSSRFMFSR